ncbi:MAG: AMP-binding protein, partial [Planctomycetes bacterium]|nr:AMP-binding protein [Planctomycetota bacterium]
MNAREKATGRAQERPLIDPASAGVQPQRLSEYPPSPLPSRLRLGPRDTVFAVISQTAASFSTRTALARRSAIDSKPVSFQDLVETVRALAAGIRELGVRHGDRVAIVAENEWRWLVTDLAVLSMGAVDVPRGLASDREELRSILEHSECRFAFVQDRTLAEELASGSLLGKRRLESVVFMGAPNEDAPSGTISFDAVLTRGRAAIRSGLVNAADWESPVRPDDLATLVYTSGTTGMPKGVMLTHRNIVANIRMVPLVLDLDEKDRFLSILPTWHMFERTLEYIALSCGAQIIYTNKKRLREDLAGQEITLLGSVPRIWESLHDAVHEDISHRPPLARWIARALLSVGRAELRARRAGAGHVARFPDLGRRGQLSARARAVALRPLAAIGELLLFRKIREAVGAALLPADRAEYERHRDAARAALGEATFAAAWSAGRAMPVDDAVAYALQ